MERYRNSSGTSGVNSFEIGDDYIRAKFSGTAQTYTYSYQGKAGSNHVENMKTLARRGSGLNAYIKTHVNKLYDK
jgi:hypothetical protein